MPAALLGLFVAALVASGAYSRRAASPAGLVHAVSRDPGWAAFIGFAILVGGLILLPFQIALVQVLEGYWGDWVLARFLAAAFIEHHRRRIDTTTILSDAKAPAPPNSSLDAAVRAARARRRAGRIVSRADRLLLAYPAGRGEEGTAGFDDRLMPTMPTMLGNLLRNAEDAAGDRYGLDMPTVYERIYPAIAYQRGGTTCADQFSAATADISAFADISTAVHVTRGIRTRGEVRRIR